MERFKNITKEMESLYEKKNKDYGSSFDESIEKFGLTAAAVRMSDKFNRVCNLIKNNPEIKEESIRDTLIDLANYSVMTIMDIENKK